MTTLKLEINTDLRDAADAERDAAPDATSEEIVASLRDHFPELVEEHVERLICLGLTALVDSRQSAHRNRRIHDLALEACRVLKKAERAVVKGDDAARHEHLGKVREIVVLMNRVIHSVPTMTDKLPPKAN
jgi:hypothetical protein